LNVNTKWSNTGVIKGKNLNKLIAPVLAQVSQAHKALLAERFTYSPRVKHLSNPPPVS